MNGDELPYHELPDPPADLSGAAVMARLVDGLGFRYRWATEDLRTEDAAFRPGTGSMSLLDLAHHVCRLVSWVDTHLDGPPAGPAPADLAELRQQTLQHLLAIRTRLLAMGDEQLARCSITNSKGTVPFWNMINGPLADALTHVGQINAWRRLSGNPTPRADVFRGKAP